MHECKRTTQARTEPSGDALLRSPRFLAVGSRHVSSLLPLLAEVKGLSQSFITNPINPFKVYHIHEKKASSSAGEGAVHFFARSALWRAWLRAPQALLPRKGCHYSTTLGAPLTVYSSDRACPCHAKNELHPHLTGRVVAKFFFAACGLCWRMKERGKRAWQGQAGMAGASPATTIRRRMVPTV